MSTFTASQHQSQVRELHSGLQSMSSKITVAVTGTASSVVLLAKVPNGCWIKDFVWYAIDAGGNNTWKLGIQYPTDKATSESALLTTTANTAGVQMRPSGLTIPFLVSFTATEGVQYAWVAATSVVAISASANQVFSVFYEMK